LRLRIAMEFFEMDHIFFTVLGYPMSYLEFFGLVSGVVAVVLSALANIWSWPLGIINVTLSFFLFYQVQLYPDMFLQIFFFVTNVMGWWRWANPRPGEEDKHKYLRVSFLPFRKLIYYTLLSVAGTVVMAFFAQHLHEWLPTIFIKPSASPFTDSFITIMSVMATFLMIQKRAECWIIWVLVDVVATYLYFVRDIKFYSLMYFAFCIIASFGFLNWWREYKSYSVQRS
jgi:nicotinamide mononucleotide transporter